MKFLVIFFFFIVSCGAIQNKVYMCGNQECKNKKEADTYFKENLSLEVKINDTNKKQNIDLVKLNEENDSSNPIKKGQYPEDKILGPIISNIEEKIFKRKQKIKIDQKNIKSNNEEKKITKVIQSRNKIESKKKEEIIKIDIKDTKKIKEINKKKQKVQFKDYTSICKDIKDCNIDKISELLIERDIEKEFPDITKK